MKKLSRANNWIMFGAIVSFIMTLVGLYRDCPLFYNVGFGVVFLSFLWYLVVSIFYVAKKRHEKIVSAIGSLILLGVFGLMLMLFYQIAPIRDRFADNLKIPNNISLDYPYDNYDKANGAESRNIPDLILVNGGQGGQYYYMLIADSLDTGSIYLKAYEITGNHNLSYNTLPEKSKIEIKVPVDSPTKISSPNYFTIHEGDWGYPYAARFEVWVIPANGASEYKYLEKIFVIEGWQR